VPDAADPAISFNVVGAVDNVWGELGCQSVPVHNGGPELAWCGHPRLQLEGPAVGGSHSCDYNLQLARWRWCELRLSYAGEM
jgi:hypothetical protein